MREIDQQPKCNGVVPGDIEKDEDQGQEPEVDVDVPGSAGLAADVFRVGTPGSVCAVCRGICGYRVCSWKCVYAAPWLGIGSGPGCRQTTPDHGGHAAAHIYD